ncbi:MAG: acyl-CoA dehydrogenase family protein [Pseudomonadota bacterium]|nr:acyl-CoA dehydrogenase family protein [Pseudomonadota bacterium]
MTQPRTDSTDDQLLGHARRLSLEFSGRAAEFDLARKLAQDASDAMAQAGFYRLFVPQYLGGLEASPLVSAQIFERLAQGNASCGWVAFIAATSGSTLGSIPEDTARTIFNHPNTMIAGVFAPAGKASVNNGEVTVSGRWQWGSGTQNANWILGGALVKAGDSKPSQHMILMPAEQIDFLDNWHVSGLQGTGSIDYEVSNLTLPDSHIVGFGEQHPPRTPLYQFPQFTLLAIGIGAVALGIARAAIDELVGLAQNKKRINSTSTLADRAHSHLEVARAEATLRSARAFYYQSIEEAWLAAETGERVSIEQRRDIRLATTHAVEASIKTVNAMYTLGGGSVVYADSPLQRHLRDVHVTSQHIMVAPSTLETVGRLYLGVDAQTSTL